MDYLILMDEVFMNIPILRDAITQLGNLISSITERMKCAPFCYLTPFSGVIATMSMVCV
jgi:hypothetical protein